MNIDKMINMLLIKLSEKQNIFYMEKRNYINGKTYKSYIISIKKQSEEFKSKRELLLYLKEMV